VLKNVVFSFELISCYPVKLEVKLHAFYGWVTFSQKEPDGWMIFLPESSSSKKNVIKKTAIFGGFKVFNPNCGRQKNG